MRGRVVHINWRAILSGLVGGAVAAVVGGYAVTTGLAAHPETYTASDLAWAAGVMLVGGVAATAAGWGINARRDAGLSGIAAIVSFLGAVGATFSWASVVAPLTGAWTLVVGTVLMIGLSLVWFVVVCGTTAAVLKPASVQREHEPVT